MAKECELCKLEKKTNWYYDGKHYVILECADHKVPMAVWRTHGEAPDKEHIYQIIIKMSELFPDRKPKWADEHNFVPYQTKLHNHWHLHFF